MRRTPRAPTGRDEPIATTEDPRTSKPRLRRQRPWPRRDGVFRFTINQFYKLDDLGYFEDRHVELIDGVIYEMTRRPAHAVGVQLATHILIATFAGRSVRSGLPLDVGRRSLPEPDLAVVVGGPRDYADNHPTTALLIMKVSDSTLRKDRTLKVHLYAYAGLADYWLLNLVDRQLEIYRNPGPDPARKGRFTFAEVTIVPADGHASPLAAPGARIAVADLLP